MTVPKWTNKAEVKRWAFRVIDGQERYSPDGDTGLQIRFFTGGQIFHKLEQAAIVAAEGNNFQPMNELVTKSPTFELLRSRYQQRLSPQAEKLIMDRATDKPRKMGKRKQTAEQRKANTPAAPAYDQYLALKKLFDAAFPKEEGIDALAMEFAAERADIPYNRLENYRHKQEQEKRKWAYHVKSK
jgi:hypothetical protein